MNKYQEALDKLKNMGDKDLYNERHLEWLNILQELVDKEIPKKVEYYYCDDGYGSCPKCHWVLEHERSYCEVCGQALDWSGKDE